ncbi:hypothetical protein HVZ46_19940 [Citrobacter freundii]|uniref:hypothetical protein n=1 Tax=Citrobacter freundii TaxID=546 RepID=UPI0015E9ED26|nr:hypothetical protein [Citrobacter freundii]QMD26690.1 hypothetical protein HVZ46_19940 [Citrobacter freundii]
MRPLFTILFFLILNSGNLYLFYHGKFSSTEFISSFSILTIISLIIFFATEIQELSIAGNIVKLREVKKDAEQVINDLQKSRLFTLSFLLDLSKKYNGGLASIGPKDERLDNFFFLYENIKTANLEKDLASKISSCADLFLQAQLKHCLQYYSKIDNTQTYTPDELTYEALKDENLVTTEHQDANTARRNAIEAINHFTKLHAIKTIADNNMTN